MPQSALTLWAVRSRLVLSRSIGFAVCEKAGSDRAANSRKVLFSMAARLVRSEGKFKADIGEGRGRVTWRCSLFCHSESAQRGGTCLHSPCWLCLGSSKLGIAND